MHHSVAITLYGSPGCPDCEEQKEILATLPYPVKFIDIESEDEEDLVEIMKYEIDDIPTIIVIKEYNEKRRFFRHCGILAAHKIQQFIDKI
jgi:glutaredoxin